MITISLCEGPPEASGLSWAAIREDFPGGVGIGATMEDALEDLRRIVQEYNELAPTAGLPLLDPDPAIQYRMRTHTSEYTGTVAAQITMASATVFAAA